VRIVSYSPPSITIQLDSISTDTFPIQLIVKGEPAIGYQADAAVLSETDVVLSGPTTKLQQVVEVRGTLDIEGVSEPIDREITLQPLDINGREVDDLTIEPEEVSVTQSITQRGGYRNVIVKVITTGQIASGYRVTNISVFPPAVTVFSDDPILVEQMPGYIETLPLDLTGIKDDLDLNLSLNLPPGVTLVEEQEVEVQVGVAAIEGSITLENMPITVTGLGTGYEVEISPETVDVILSGPLPILDTLRSSDVRILLDLQGLLEGVYQRIPEVVISQDDIRLQSLLPGSLEVRISLLPTPTITPTASIGEDLSLTTTPTPTTTPVP
jgi:YbbR domain-containing protein